MYIGYSLKARVLEDLSRTCGETTKMKIIKSEPHQFTIQVILLYDYLGLKMGYRVDKTMSRTCQGFGQIVDG